MTAIRVLIVDDHPLMRRALTAAIETEYDLKVVGTAINGVHAQKAVAELKPDVILMDLLMPVGNGFEAITAIHAAHPDIRILVVTSLEEEKGVLQAITAGAQGYITKAADSEELIEAIRMVYEGNSYMPPHIAAKLLTSLRDLSKETEAESDPLDELTQREMEVFGLVAKGNSNAQIGEALHVSPSTVNVHIHNMMNKLGISKRRKLVAFAAQNLNSR